MKTFVLITTLGMASLCAQNVFAPGISPDPNRFAVPIKGKFGFISTSGQVVIAPEFESVQEFSDGLCAVRLDGRYGFIDNKGEMVIPEQFDYATQFSEGLALVYLEGKPFFVDKGGKKAFDHVYQRLSHFLDGRAYVQTYSGKRGIINKTGELQVDTAYAYISPFHDNVAIVQGMDHDPYPDKGKKRILQASLINEAGKVLIPYGKFEEIKGPFDGYYKVYIARKNEK